MQGVLIAGFAALQKKVISGLYGFVVAVLQLGCGVLSSVCPISFWFSFYINTYQFMRFVPLFVPPFAVFYVAFISLTEQLRPHMLRELDIRAELEARQM